MKYINKKIIKSIAVFACVAGLLLSFTGCSGITGNKKQEEKTQKSCTVSGSVITEGQNAISSERTATTSFSIPEGAEYILRAYWGQTDPNANMFNIDIDSETIGTFDSDTMKYSIELIKAGTWSIELGFVQNGSVDLIAQRMVEVGETLADLTDADLFIIADFDYYINGNAESEEIVTSQINLEISKDPSSTDISAVKWVWKELNNPGSDNIPSKVSDWFRKLTDDTESSDYEEYPKTITKNFEDNKVTFTFEEVPTWSYTVSLIIVKSNGDEYVFDEVVNVFQNFITDTWYGDSMHLKKDSTGKYSFFVSNELLAKLPKKGNYAEITESSTPYVLYSDYEREAYHFVSQYGSGVFDYDEELDDGVIGTQVFTTIDGDEKIENPISKSSNFCFGDNEIYILETQKESEFSPLSSIILKKCKKSYSGYTKEGTGISLLEKLSDFISGDSDISEVSQITYSNGFICFQWGYSRNETKTYSFAVVDADSGELVNSQFEVSNLLPGIVVNTKKTDINIQGEPNTKYEGYLYYYDKDNYSSPESLKEIAITIKSNIVENTETLDSVTFGSSIPVLELKAENLKSNSTDEDIEYGKLRFGDMILQDDYLYVLVRSSGRIELNSNENSEEPVYLYQSTGGVLRFSVSETDGRLTQENWIINSESKKLLGAYTRRITEEDNYYKYNSQDCTYYPYTNVCALQPPLDSTQVYFYGPQRFIARKPDALVIADDGGYIEDDDESSSSLTAKNRVVTVNLTDLSLSAVDVKATFTSTFNMASSGYAYID